jgi:predicted RNA-binding protein with PUA-like domain
MPTSPASGEVPRECGDWKCTKLKRRLEAYQIKEWMVGMTYWLLKTEPETFSWDDQVARGAKGEPWTGVRNYRARGHLKAMKIGDRAFFYHTGGEKQVVGIVEVIREAYPDPTDETGVFRAVDVKAVRPLPKAVTLAVVKADPRLKDMVLARQPRLSVQPVTAEEWRMICTMGGLR